MSTITKEQLRERARQKVKSLEFSITQTAFADIRAELEEELELARIALASLEAEAVITVGDDGGDALAYRRLIQTFAPGTKLYTAPPAPVSVPDELPPHEDESYGSEDDCYKAGRVEGWNACRAAMLQGASGNSPVIPDGWVLVPVEPTEKMVIEGFESEPDEFFSKSEEWEAYQKMSGCEQAAHRAKLCWAAMIAAAPQQEVKS
ncbi:TPA: hypothetical protein NV717_002940 [Escherichia coli]|nr:hypothetical protein [Escherichia coli]